MARAKWSTVPSQVIARTEADGTFTFAAPLLDNGVKQMTLRLTVTADRQVRLLVDGEPGATLSGFQAWSDL
jgi:hypothetical protein